MSDPIKHECGIGLIRLLKPLSYYAQKYGSLLWGLNKMYLLMEKQHNRGQDGAGIACVKLDVREGLPYMSRLRNNQPSPWIQVFKEIQQELEELKTKYPDIQNDPDLLRDHFRFGGQLLMGHLRYGTHGQNTINSVHPVVRASNWKARSLMVAGNFNLTNVPELFKQLVELGQHPRHFTDTETVLERIGHFLDKENDQLYAKYSKDKGLNPRELTHKVANSINLRRVLARSAKRWDGGYVMGGLIGCGDAFIARDPNGIRPCSYYANDEFLVVASERPAISTVFDVDYEHIKELQPGHLLSVKADGRIKEMAFTEPKEKKSCSFERIYFSRGNDPDIYRERINLGNLLVPKILESVNNDLENTVFSYIPNTAENAFWGMIKGVETYMNEQKIKQISELGGNISEEDLQRILRARPRVEKAVIKDIKLRTFIADDNARDDLVAHVYDVTKGVLNEGKDNFVCIDDSIVRGTTLKKSILRILERLQPKKIVIVSSAPQIRYPDCYGIDMSQIGRFVAFQAAIALLKGRGMNHVIDKAYKECIAMKENDLLDTKNAVKAIYEPFTEDEISRKIADLLKPETMQCKLEIVYQPLSNLGKAIPDHRGDWYFSGDFPTPGGNRVTNKAFINYIEGRQDRSY